MSTEHVKEPIDSALWTGRYPRPRRIVQTFRIVVDYSEDVTAAQVNRVDDLVRGEFSTGGWVAVETENAS